MSLRSLRLEDKTSRNIRMNSRDRYRRGTRSEKWSNSRENAHLAHIRMLLHLRTSIKEGWAIIIILQTLTCHKSHRNSLKWNQRTSYKHRINIACWVRELHLHPQRWIITQTWHRMLPPIDCLNLYNIKNQFKVTPNPISTHKTFYFSKKSTLIST